MIDIDLGFDAPQSHLSQPLAANFVHHRFGGAIRGLATGGLGGALGGFLSPGTTKRDPNINVALGTSGAVVPGTGAGPGAVTTAVPGTIGGFLGIGVSPTATPTSTTGPCGFMQSWDPLTGRCRFDLDPGAGTGFPGGPQVSAGGTVDGQGIVFPNPVERLVQDCPTMPNGKKGILWMGAQDGVLVCLPRGVNGRPMGYVRKNKPRRKPFITAAQISELRRKSSLTKKAKEFAKLTGQTCKPRGRGR